MKLLMVNLPFAGHSNPTMGLAKELIALGHEVSYIHSFEWKDRVVATGSNFIPYVETTSENYKRLKLRYWRLAYKTVAAELPKHDALIYEMLFIAGKSLADKCGKPAIRLFSTFALNRNILSDFGRTGGPYLTAVFRYQILYKLISFLICRSFRLEKKDLICELTENTPNLNFVYTIRDFQIDEATFPKSQYYFIGPSISARVPVLFDFDFSKAAYPIIYISMGTMINLSTQFYEKCIAAFGNKDVIVIISLGHSVKVESFKSVPNNIFLYSFVPQLEVLENSDLFITHGGMNSVNEGLYYGVPMLIIPIGNDQPTVANRVEEIGLGKKIDPKNVSVESLYIEAQNTIKLVEKGIIKEFQKKSVSAGGNKFAARMVTEYVE